MKYKAVRLIKEEHRSLSAVIHAIEYLVRKAANTGKAPDFRLLHAMMYYIREFPERLHHPNEDRVLFARIKLRTHEADSAIAELEGEHQRGEAMLAKLTITLSNWEADAANGARKFADALTGFADFYWKHMEKEEKQVLPVAERALSAEDWHAVHAAFEAHSDPMFGDDTANEFRDLFTRIVQLAPPPIGLGPPEP